LKANSRHSYFEFTGHTIETKDDAPIRGLCPRNGDWRSFQAAPKKLRLFAEQVIRGVGPEGSGWEGKALKTLKMPGENEMWMMDEAEKTVVRRFRGTETRTPDRLAGLVSVQIHFGQALSGTPHRDTAAGAFHVGVTASGTRADAEVQRAQ
jgi:hypothetical protein